MLSYIIPQVCSFSSLISAAVIKHSEQKRFEEGRVSVV